MLKFFFDALTKPFQVYLRPQAKADALRASLPEDSADMSLLILITGWSQLDRAALIKALMKEYLKYLIAFLWFPIIYFTMKAFIPQLEPIDKALSISFISALLFLPFASMLWRSISFGLGWAWGFLIALGFGGLVHFLFLQEYAYANYGAINSDTIAQTVDSQEATFAIAALAVAMGLFARVTFLGASKWAYPIYGIGILLCGLWALAAPSIGKTDAIDQWNRLFSIAALIGFSGIWLYPFGLLLSLLMAIMPNGGAAIWRLSPAYWDEFYMLPVPRLSNIYAYLQASQPESAQELAEALRRNPVHRRALPKQKPVDDFAQFMQES
jgi:hypothetical protein